MSFGAIRDFARGKIGASDLRATLNESALDDDEFLTDEEFIQECTALIQGMIIQGEMLDEAADVMDEMVNEAAAELGGYMVGQGIINEASININNPRVNYVRLNRQAQINRLEKIITLKMGRKAKHPAFKKYKLAMALKKKNMAEMHKLYGVRANRLAKQMYAKIAKNKKIGATITDKKIEVKKAMK